MQRLREERGAVAVIVGILMVALLGFAAIAIDVSGLWSKKQQLQNGADAGALAIAQTCAKGACGSTAAAANKYASSNVVDGAATGTVLTPNPVLPTSGTVTVQTSDTQERWLARIWGSNDSTVHAKATAKWGGPSGGTTIPLAFSWCEWNKQTSTVGLDSTLPHPILFPKKSDTGCTGPNGLNVAGGFAWLDPDTKKGCQETSSLTGTGDDVWIPSSSGNTPPGGCDNAWFSNLVGTTLLIPIFNEVGPGTGAGATYHLYGFAAFKLTGYFFGGSYKYPTSSPPCGNPDRCIAGYFTRYVSLSEVLTVGGGGPQLGLSIITLTA
jgi:hypothetical protein